MLWLTKRKACSRKTAQIVWIKIMVQHHTIFNWMEEFFFNFLLQKKIAIYFLFLTQTLPLNTHKLNTKKGFLENQIFFIVFTYHQKELNWTTIDRQKIWSILLMARQGSDNQLTPFWLLTTQFFFFLFFSCTVSEIVKYQKILPNWQVILAILKTSIIL